jgi:Cof subfamily protein (haloacid dehalogenase superfamily)
MNSSFPQLVVTDLDGTLLAFHGKVSKKNYEALSLLELKGIPLVVATGRNLPLISDDVLSLPALNYLILSGGASIYSLHEKKEIYSRTISSQNVISLLQSLINYSYSVRLLYKDLTVVNKSGFNNYFLHFLKKKMPQAKFVVTEDPIVYLRGSHEQVSKVDIHLSRKKDLKESSNLLFLAKGFNCLQVGEKDFELTSYATDKSIALNNLCDKLQVTLENVLAFGDSGNDAPLANSPLYFIATSDADGKIKKLAKEVTSSSASSGVGKSIYRILKEGLKNGN